MFYHFKIHKEKNKFWAQCLELPGCVTQADSLKKLQINMQEALNLYIEEPNDSKSVTAPPNISIKPSKTIVRVTVSPRPTIAKT